MLKLLQFYVPKNVINGAYMEINLPLPEVSYEKLLGIRKSK